MDDKQLDSARPIVDPFLAEDDARQKVLDAIDAYVKVLVLKPQPPKLNIRRRV
jgi:hypothetical protein